jgi:hypothetical protein
MYFSPEQHVAGCRSGPLEGEPRRRDNVEAAHQRTWRPRRRRSTTTACARRRNRQAIRRHHQHPVRRDRLARAHHRRRTRGELRSTSPAQPLDEASTKQKIQVPPVPVVARMTPELTQIDRPVRHGRRCRPAEGPSRRVAAPQGHTARRCLSGRDRCEATARSGRRPCQPRARGASQLRVLEFV